MLFEAQESQKLETISSHEELLRASANCQMQTNIFNNLKLIYCTGKAVRLKKQIHIGLAVDNKYDKFVVLQWLRKSSVWSFSVQMYRGTKQRGSRLLFGILLWLEAGDCAQLQTRLCQRGIVRRKQRRTQEFLYKREDYAK